MLLGTKRHSDRGFTLIEMLVVLIIIGILVVLALPKYSGVIFKAKSAEAKLMLAQVITLQKAYYQEHDRYSMDLHEIGFRQETLVTENGTARYIISMESASDTNFVVLATSVIDFDKDNVFNVWHADKRNSISERVRD